MLGGDDAGKERHQNTRCGSITSKVVDSGSPMYAAEEGKGKRKYAAWKPRVDKEIDFREHITIGELAGRAGRS
jgi:hypothetical protein